MLAGLVLVWTSGLLTLSPFYCVASVPWFKCVPSGSNQQLSGTPLPALQAAAPVYTLK